MPSLYAARAARDGSTDDSYYLLAERVLIDAMVPAALQGQACALTLDRSYPLHEIT